MTEQVHQAFWEEQQLPAPGTRMTITEYFALPETLIRIELIDGVVVYPHWNEEIMSAAPVPYHQDIVLSVAAALRAYAKIHGGSAHIAPLDIVLPNGSVVQPDVMWRSANSACVRTEKRYRGAPELIAEVLSPGTAVHDRRDKYALYETAGVGEYCIVDPRDDLLEVYVLSDDGFRRLGVYGGADAFKSPTLNHTITVSELFDV